MVSLEELKKEVQEYPNVVIGFIKDRAIIREAALRGYMSWDDYFKQVAFIEEHAFQQGVRKENIRSVY